MFLNERCEGLGKEMECSLPEIFSCCMKQKWTYAPLIFVWSVVTVFVLFKETALVSNRTILEHFLTNFLHSSCLSCINYIFKNSLSVFGMMGNANNILLLWYFYLVLESTSTDSFNACDVSTKNPASLHIAILC